MRKGKQLQLLPTLARIPLTAGGQLGRDRAITLHQVHYLGLRTPDGWVTRTVREFADEDFGGCATEPMVAGWLKVLRAEKLVEGRQPHGADRTYAQRLVYERLVELAPKVGSAMLEEARSAGRKPRNSALARAGDDGPSKNTTGGEARAGARDTTSSDSNVAAFPPGGRGGYDQVLEQM